MTAAELPSKNGKFTLVIAIVSFTAVLILLLMTAGSGNATHAPKARVPLTVSTGTIEIQSNFETPINVFGLVESPKAATLSFDVVGQVTDMLVEEGDMVKKGDILARLDMQRLSARKRELQASLERADANLVLAKVNNERITSLVNSKLESEQLLDEAKASLNVAKAQVRETKAALNSLGIEIEKASLVSPFDGVINRRFLDEGGVVNAGSPVFGITSIESYQARFAVPADVVEQFEIDSSVPVRIGDRDIAGKVTKRLPVRNVQTRTVDILVTLQSNEGVRPGDMAILSGSRSHSDIGAWLPVDALSNGLRGLWRVFILSSEPSATLEVRVVELVYTDGVNAFVRGALKDGDIYVNEGTHKLAPGQMVSLSSQRQMGDL